MQLIRGHKLNEEFIEEMKPEDISQESVDVTEDEPVYRFIFNATFNYNKITSYPKLLPKLFNTLYLAFSKALFVRKVVKMEAGYDDSVDEQFNPLTFREFYEYEILPMCQRTNMEFARIEIFFKVYVTVEKTSYRKFFSDYLRIYDAVFRKLHQLTYLMPNLFFRDESDNTDVVVMSDSEPRQMTIIQLYRMLFKDKVEPFSDERVAELTYRSPRRKIVSEMFFIKDNPDTFRGFETAINGIRQTSNSYGTITMKFYLEVMPKSERYATAESVFNIGKTIISGLKESDLRDLRPAGNDPSFGKFMMFFHIPKSIQRNIKSGENWSRVIEDSENKIVFVMCLYDDYYRYWEDGELLNVFPESEEPQQDMLAIIAQMDKMYQNEQKNKKSLNRKS